MSKNTNRRTTRERREYKKRNTFFVHILISVVALIECLLLLVFTTYSWIETSSSLIISTGKGGVEGSMAVAHNLNYQVLIATGSGGKAKLVPKKNVEDETYEGGYYRTVQNFSFAKTSSKNGTDFYFRTGAGSTLYRENDTTDFNTNYTYLDFEVKNTTGFAKQFCFAQGSHDNIFTYTSGLSANGSDTQLDTTYKSIILNAMRISFEVVEDESGNETAPLILSLDPETYSPISDTSGNTTTITYDDTVSTGLRYHSLKSHEYDTSDDAVQNPLFISDPGRSNESVTDRIAVRIWFDEKDAAYAALDDTTTDDNDKTAKDYCDEALNAAKISVNFSLVSDTIDYDTIYFDDYAFSNVAGKAGKFVTDEVDDFGMYLRAFNGKSNTYERFEMTKVQSTDIAANRWTVTVPLQYVVEQGNNHYLTSNSEQWNNAYFYYGNAEGTKIRYKWNFSSLGANYMSLTPITEEDGSSILVFGNKCNYFRNIGVVRDSTNYNTDNYSAPVEGFLQYDRCYDNATNGKMQLIKFRDHATAITGEDYNKSADGVLNYRYISNQATKQYTVTTPETIEVPGGGSGSSSGGTKTLDYSMVPNSEITQLDRPENFYDRIFYADVPQGWCLQFYVGDYSGFENNSNPAHNRTLSNQEGSTPVPTAVDGRCYRISTGYANNGEQKAVTYGGTVLNFDLSTLPALNSGDGWVRVYFYMMDIGSTGWIRTNNVVKIHTWQGSSPTGAGGYTVPDKVAETTIRDAAAYEIKGGGGSDEDDPVEINETYQRSKVGLYLNLNNATSAKKTIGTYYDDSASEQCFKAYVPQNWLTGFDIHYNELDGYYDRARDKIRWSTAAAGDSRVYTLLGYTNNYTVAELNDLTASPVVPIGTGVGTWSTARRIEFSNELLYTNVGASKLYKTGISSATYPMVPSSGDNLHYKSFAYVASDGLSTQSSHPVLRFERYDADMTNSGLWYPHENIGSTEMTYYAVDAVADPINGNPTFANRGWFHLAVFVDGTFENLVYDTLYGSDSVENAKLEFKDNNGSVYQSIVTSHGSSSAPSLGTNVVQIGDTRWVVPISSDSNYVYFRWTPYPNANESLATRFDYTLKVSDGIYCVVTE